MENCLSGSVMIFISIQRQFRPALTISPLLFKIISLWWTSRVQLVLYLFQVIYLSVARVRVCPAIDDHLGVETDAAPFYDQWKAVYEEFGNENCGSFGKRSQLFHRDFIFLSFLIPFHNNS
jgi:hypothetical protein